MSKKADIRLIEHVLKRHELDIRQIARIVKDIQEEVDNAVEEKPPPVKKQFVVMISDPEGAIQDKAMTGWVLQLPEEDSPYLAEERLVRAGYEFNVSPKGRRLPVKSIGEACEVVPTRLLKEQNVWVKTKEPVMVVTTNNEIPSAVAKKPYSNGNS